MSRWREATVLLALAPAVLADTCLSEGQLAGLIFGSVGVTFVICTIVAVLLWYFLRATETVKTSEKSAYVNESCDVVEKGCDAANVEHKDKGTLIDSYKLKRKFDFGAQKCYSQENLKQAECNVKLSNKDLEGLGFNIAGNMSEGIFVKNVIPKGAAEKCGNIYEGDRIKSLTVCFESMVYEDAITLLSYASPYKVKLELERRVEDAPLPSSPTPGETRVHPLFRSNTLTHCHFNPCHTSPAPIRGNSLDGDQKHALPDSAVEEEVKEAPVEQVEMEIVMKKVEEKEEVSAPLPMPAAVSPPPIVSTTVDETCSEHSSTSPPPPVDSSSPVNETTEKSSDYSSDCSYKDDSMATSTISTHSREVVDKPETIEEVAVQQTIISPVPPRDEEVEYSIPVKTKRETKVTSPAIHRSPSKPREKIEYAVAQPVVKRQIQPPSPPRNPQFAEARVSRIPKKDAAPKTPIIERKLPKLPRSVERGPSDAADKGDIWSRLYQEKKGNLRKTRDLPPTPGSQIPTMHKSSVGSSGVSSAGTDKPGENRFGTLSRDRRDKLSANQQILDQQTEELRKLGVL